MSLVNETLLFWGVLFAFLLFDNLISIGRDVDCLNVSRKGKLSYKLRNRQIFGGKEIILLNPLNLFDRIIFSSKVTASENVAEYKRELRGIERTAKKINFFVYLGYFYLLILIVNCYASLALSFEAIAIELIVCHVVTWVVAVMSVFFLVRDDSLPVRMITIILIEALFVPAYLVNLNKKILVLRKSSICPVRLCVRRFKTVPEYERELVRYELSRFIQGSMDEEVSPEKIEALKKIEKCLKT
jgi:hypothetical protein